MNDLTLFLQLSVQLGTPLLLATLGGILNEKVGNLNLSIEGMMMVGACAGFSVALQQQFANMGDCGSRLRRSGSLIDLRIGNCDLQRQSDGYRLRSYYPRNRNCEFCR